MACLGTSGRQGLSVAIGSRAFHNSNSHINHRFLCRPLVQKTVSSSHSPSPIDCSETCLFTNTAADAAAAAAAASNNLNDTSNGSSSKSQYVSASSSKSIALPHFLLHRRTLHLWIIGPPRAASCTTANGSSVAATCCSKSYTRSTMVSYTGSLYIITETEHCVAL